MSFDGNQYETAASEVMTTKGDLVRYDSQRERYGIGSAGQVLQVSSGLPSWQTLSTASSVLTTQGDVLIRNASGLARLGQSTQYYTLSTNGAGADPTWIESANSIMTTAGDLLIADAANSLSRLARGSDNQVLTMDGTNLVWETASGGGATTAKKSAVNSADFSTSSTSYVDLTDVTVTITDNAGQFFSSLMASAKTSHSAYNGRIILDDDGTDSKAMYFDRDRFTSSSISYVGDNDGQTFKAQVQASGGTVDVSGGTDGAYAFLEVLEVS